LDSESLLILSNKEKHALSALEELKEYGDVTKAHWAKCDFEDLKFTDKVANEPVSKEGKLDGVNGHEDWDTWPYACRQYLS
jgi:hypothetical protein